MNWYRTIANERLDRDMRLEAIIELKQFFKKILRINRSHGVGVVACTDDVILPFMKAPKGVIPAITDLSIRLKAVRVSVDHEFPDLPSPVSVRSYPPSVTSQEMLPVAYSQIVKGVKDVPAREEVAGPSSAPQLKTVVSKTAAAPCDEPDLGESSSPGVDVTRNPIVIEISNVLNTRFATYEKALGTLIEKVAAGENDIASN